MAWCQLLPLPTLRLVSTLVKPFQCNSPTLLQLRSVHTLEAVCLPSIVPTFAFPDLMVAGDESAAIVFEYLNGVAGLNSTLKWPTSCEGPDVVFGCVCRLDLPDWQLMKQ